MNTNNTDLLNTNLFYIYIYLDPRKPGRYSYPNINMSFLYQPFYVGKGVEKRMYAHLKDNVLSNESYKSNKILNILKAYSKEELKKYIFVTNESENEDFIYECEYDYIKI